MTQYPERKKAGRTATLITFICAAGGIYVIFLLVWITILTLEALLA